MIRCLALAATLLTLAMPAAAQDLTIFAASSLKTALDQVAASFTAETGTKVAISYAASPALAKQIEQGAPADIFISASSDWMDELANANLIQPASRRDLLSNTLILIASGPMATPIDLATTDLTDLLGDGKLAMAMVDSVPAGVYGKQALTALGQWDALAPHVAQTENARTALALVASGEAPYGITFLTDANASDAVTEIYDFPAETHAPILYPAALTSMALPEAQALLTYLAGPAATAIFAAQGFAPLP